MFNRISALILSALLLFATGAGAYTEGDFGYSPGGTAGTSISGFPATLETFLVAGGAGQTGTVYNFPSGRATVQASLSNTTTPTGTIKVYGSNDNVGFILLGTITLSGASDTDGFAMDAPWAYIRSDVSNLTGTSATCTVTMGQ